MNTPNQFPESLPSANSDTPSTWDNLKQEVPFIDDTDHINTPDNTNNTANFAPNNTELPQVTLPDLPTKSPDRTCNFYLRLIESQGDMDKVKAFLESALSREYHDFTSDSTAELDDFCDTYSAELSAALTPEDQAALKRYSGFDYKVINQVARGQWNYDLLGAKTPEKAASAEAAISQIDHAISIAPAIDADLITHRGTNLDGFQRYGVHSLAELANLENQFFLETSFTSTSLTSDKSFADREFDDPLRRTCDIAVEYLLPAENRETIGLLSHETSYNPEQNEIVIDKGSLSYISNVEINPDQSSAKLQMVLIPRQVYDPATR